MRRIKGVIELLIVAALVGLIVWTNVIPDEGRRIEDSTYVDDAQVLPENEGKRVIIAGRVEADSRVTDPDMGFTFPSPVAMRTVERLKYSSAIGWKWETIYEESTTSDFKGATFAESATLGEFTLDPALVQRLPGSWRSWYEEDVDADELARLGSSWTFTTEEGELYLTQAPYVSEDAEYVIYQDYEGSYRVRYRIWSSDSLEATVVGIQRGSTLEYDPDLNAGSTFEGILDAEEVVKSNNMGVLIGEIIFAGIPAVLLSILGVRNLLDL